MNMNKAEFISYSFDVKVEGKCCARALDLMLHNSKNTPPTPVIQPPLIVIVMEEPPPAPENPKDWGVDKIEVI